MAAPLCRMPPLAAAASECTLFGELGAQPVTLSPTASDRYYSSVRLHGDLVVFHWKRPVGPLRGPDREPLKKPGFVHQEPPRPFDHTFPLLAGLNADNPSLCRDAINEVLLRARTPLGFGTGSWDSLQDESLAGQLATLAVDEVRREGGAGEHHGVSQRFDINIDLTIEVAIVYDEPRALLLACSKPAAVLPKAACSVCFEGFKAEEAIVSLACLHSFHRRCILKWFERAATCPICRQDMTHHLTEVTKAEVRTAPGLGP